jgi:hypothetical protein
MLPQLEVKTNVKQIINKTIRSIQFHPPSPFNLLILLYILGKINNKNLNKKGVEIIMERQIDGKCRHNVYHKQSDPCFRCAFCTIDGNDYSDSRSGKPHI